MTTTGSIVHKSSLPSPKTVSARDGSAFSAVLGLKLGMGITTTLKIEAKATPQHAQKRSAEPAREAQPLGDTPEPAQPRAEASAAPTADTQAETHTPSVQESPRTEPKPAGRDTADEPRADVSNHDAGLVSSPDESAVPSHEAAVRPSTPTAPQEQSAFITATAEAPLTPTRTLAKPASTAKSAAIEARTEIVGRRSVEQTTPHKAEPTESTDVKAASSGSPRDPLGLIQPEPLEPGTTKVPTESRQTAEPGIPVAQSASSSPAEPRIRFADTVNHASPSQPAEAAAGATLARGTVLPISHIPTQGATPVAGLAAGGGVGAGSGGMKGDTGGQSSGQSNQNSGGPFAGLAGGRHGILGTVRPGRAALTISAGIEPGESREKVQAQIARGLVAALKQKGGVMTLRLNPEHLGSIKIDLTIEAGRVSAFFDAETDAARRILRDSVDDLRRSIEQTGLSAQRIEVSGPVLGPTHQSSSNHNPSSQNTANPDGERQQARDDTADRRREERSSERFDDDTPPRDGPVGGVFVDDSAPAHGLRRLRVDAIV
jgi:flagellar hook-length control protein FliK